MAKIIAIYNNKGGVGKTTLTLFLADFLSSTSIDKKKSRVLVIDFDPQASCSTALLGLEEVSKLKNNRLTLPVLLQAKLYGQGDTNLKGCIKTRQEDITKKTRKTKLGNLDVMLSEADAVLSFDEHVSSQDSLQLTEWLKTEINNDYDFVLVDLPGNLSKRNVFSLVGAFLADYFIIPTEPNRININALPATLKMLSSMNEWRGNSPHKLLGFVLNKADKRTIQYKLHKDELTQFANRENCKIYSSILPPTPKLSNASDDSIEAFTLSDRYDTYYPNVRSLVMEILDDLGFHKTK